MNRKRPARGEPLGSARRRLGIGLLALAALAAVAAPDATAAGPAADPPATMPVAAAAPDAEATRRLHALFDAYWETTAQEYPEWASWRGDPRFDDRLTDASPAARARRDGLERDWLARAEGIDPATLGATDRVSREIFLFERRLAVA